MKERLNKAELRLEAAQRKKRRRRMDELLTHFWEGSFTFFFPSLIPLISLTNARLAYLKDLNRMRNVLLSAWNMS